MRGLQRFELRNGVAGDGDEARAKRAKGQSNGEVKTSLAVMGRLSQNEEKERNDHSPVW